MSRNRILSVIGLVGLSLLLVGCPKKAPETPPAPPPPVPSVPAPQEVAPAPEPPMEDETPDPWDAEIEQINQLARERGLLGDVYFDFDRYELRPDARERLAKNAQFMREHPNYVFLVEGHCDERGTNDYNLALGDRRSSAAVAYLQSLGVGGSRMKTVSYGEERPVCTQSSESCWQRNRRAFFLVTGK